jgi:hypothetical protein
LNRPLGIVFEEVGQAKWLSFSNPALRPFYFVEAYIYKSFFFCHGDFVCRSKGHVLRARFAERRV